MFKVGLGEYSVLVHRGPLSDMYGEYRKHAVLSEEFDLASSDGEACFVAVGKPLQWPSLVVAQRFSPCVGGFDPGILIVPETKVLFLGAGVRLLAYNLHDPSKMWGDTADVGFWCWNRFQDYVLMSAEIELAAWTIAGAKVWSTFVEPPWDYAVQDDQVHLDVMGRKSHFPLAAGPANR